MARLPNLNELTINTSGGTLTVVGSTASFAPSVIVNGTNSADLNHDGTFAAPNMPLTTNYTAVAEDSHFRYATNTITVNLSTNVAFQYDADGNLIQDGRWNYTWDGENRLVSMTSLSGAPTGSQCTLNFVYDYMSRRIGKMVSTNGNGYTNYFLYDGWNCIDSLNFALSTLNSFLWGNDLSGTMQGAGGVGGLLEVSYHGSATTNAFVAHDGNGNVRTLVNSTDGTTLANYDYGPFGEVIRATGPMAKVNLFRFSTKFDDDESDLVYYGCRYYNPSTGRWLSRDPINECGFEVLRVVSFQQESIDDLQRANPYGMVLNDAVDYSDVLGLIWMPGPHPHGPPPPPSRWHAVQIIAETPCELCRCSIYYEDHEKVHTPLETAYFEAELRDLELKYAAACRPGPGPAIICEQIAKLYESYY